MQTPEDSNLINLSLEDDKLLPPSLNDEFIGFRLSVSERRNCEARLLPAATGHGYEPDRKSLSWHTEFLTNDGILDSEELMVFNRGLKKKDLLKKREMRTKTVSQSHSMLRVPAKRIATYETALGNKKQRSTLSTSVRSSIVPSSSSSGGSSFKNMLKSSVSYLKKKVVPGNKGSSFSSSSVEFPSETYSAKSKADSIRPAHPGRKSMPKIPSSSKSRLSVLSPSTPPDNKSSRLYQEGLKLSLQSMSFSSTPPTKDTTFRTPVSKPSGLRIPSARFGFFDLDQKSSSSRLEETFHTAPKSTPQETTTSSATRSVKKLKCSIPSPVPYLPTLQSDANDKENKFSIEERVDDLSKHLISVDLETDLVIDLQGKRGGIQLCTPTDHSASTPPLKRAVQSQRTPLAAHNMSL